MSETVTIAIKKNEAGEFMQDRLVFASGVLLRNEELEVHKREYDYAVKTGVPVVRVGGESETKPGSKKKRATKKTAAAKGRDPDFMK